MVLALAADMVPALAVQVPAVQALAAVPGMVLQESAYSQGTQLQRQPAIPRR
ncbi:hypothetical protein [Corynebacterium sp. HMSC08C04]|uniref:hypothetical protein n=1 Tax=Corynebacterium sp. HMSC08C04 TaxID=1581137 RepID=UPI001AEF801C|nr:hypothetical protein [Corynebacterium sp. HMSC08C04]